MAEDGPVASGRGQFDLRAAQRDAWSNKLAKGFNTTDVPLEMALLNKEIGEFFDAWRRGQPDVGEELADVAVFVLGLAEMTGIDLTTEIEHKMQINAQRRYELQAGVPTKLDEPSDADARAHSRAADDQPDPQSETTEIEGRPAVIGDLDPELSEPEEAEVDDEEPEV